MLDTKKVGIKICVLRKKIGCSQEKLAEILCISPQAISRWENGHTLPDTQTLPVLAQIFGCTIDEIIMPAYSFNEKIEAEKPDFLEKQAEHIAQIVIKQIGDTIMKPNIGLDDQEIISAIKNIYPDANNFTITKSTPEKAKKDSNRKYKIIYINVNFSDKELRLVEKVFDYDDNEAKIYVGFGNRVISAVPTLFFVDTDRKILLTEDLNEGYFKGNAVMYIVTGLDKNHEEGKIYQANLKSLIRSTADFHSAFWEKPNKLPWHFESKENMFAWIHNAMEKPYKNYKNNETNGKIPRKWEIDGKIFDNTIDLKKLEYFEEALKILREEYIKLVDTRFKAGRNITLIHGDLHPGNTFMSKSVDRTVKFIDMEGTRSGLCTEDLAMLFALHIEPDKTKAELLLKYYYDCLCENVKDYPYEMFINDYKLSIAENMFFTIRLINDGITDFLMRDRAITAFETFVLA